jgi:hypothetical protein
MAEHVIVWDLETVSDLGAVARAHYLPERAVEVAREVWAEVSQAAISPDRLHWSGRKGRWSLVGLRHRARSTPGSAQRRN